MTTTEPNLISEEDSAMFNDCVADAKPVEEINPKFGNPMLDTLKYDAERAPASGGASVAWHHACECDLGEEREYAFEVYDRIRTATRK